MAVCKECMVIDSLNNAWKALVNQYHESPEEEIRTALNLISKIITKVEIDFVDIERNEEPHQITLEEWLSYLQTE